MNRLGFLFLIAVVGLLAGVAPARAQLVCGGTVGPGGTFTLTQDLDCREDAACQFPRRCTPALTVVGNAVLNLNGRAVICSSGSDDGILMSGAGGVVRDGRVDICGTGVRLAGEGRHLVRNVVALRSGNNGFTVVSDDNVLEGNVADTSGGNGFNLSGARRNNLVRNVATRTERFNGFNVGSSADDNRLRDNAAFGNAVHGFNVTSDANKLVQNTAIANGNRGYDVSGDGNTLRRNRAVANGVGIDGVGTGNVMERNSALGNESVDLKESGATCDDVWRRSVFGTTSLPDCIR